MNHMRKTRGLHKKEKMIGIEMEQRANYLRLTNWLSCFEVAAKSATNDKHNKWLLCVFLSLSRFCVITSNKNNTKSVRHLRKQRTHPWQRRERGFVCLVEVGKMCYKIDTFGAESRGAKTQSTCVTCRQRVSTLGGSVALSTPAPASPTFDQALKVGQWDNELSGHSDDVTADDYVVNERSHYSIVRSGSTWVLCVVLAART